MTLRAAPRQAVGPDGQPRFGKWSGIAQECNWQALAPPYGQVALWRRLNHKRWHFVALVTDELFCGLSVVDIGWGNSAFAYAFDRRRRQVVEAFSPLGVAGLSARVDGQIVPLAYARIEPEPGGSWRVRSTDGLLELRFTPEGTRRDDKQLVLASSRFSQLVGTFDGWVKPAAGASARQVRALPGLAEEFSARW